MTVIITHAFVSEAVDLEVEGEVSTAEWNEPHDIVMTGPALVGLNTVGDDAAVEIALGVGLEFNGAEVRVDLDVIAELSDIATAVASLVTGPGASVTADNPAVFNGTGGLTIKQVTYAAFKTALALVKGDVGLGNVSNVDQVPLSYLDTDGTLAANSDSKVASQKATKTYVDAQVANNVITDSGADRTLAASDDKKTVEMTNASACTITLPPNASVALAVGFYINFTQMGAGQITVTPGSGVTLRAQAGAKTIGQYAMGTVYKRGTNEWVVGGNMTA